MAKCDYCGSTIIFGGIRDNEFRFCNQECRSRGSVLLVSKQVPQDTVEKTAREIHQGLCPRCHGSGPIDVHSAHKVWSLLFMTSWSSKPQICCRSCGNKTRIGAALFSLLFGWWGVPWGFIMTPVQVVKNLAGIMRDSDHSGPSDELLKLVRMNIAAQAMANQKKTS